MRDFTNDANLNITTDKNEGLKTYNPESSVEDPEYVGSVPATRWAHPIYTALQNDDVEELKSILAEFPEAVHVLGNKDRLTLHYAESPDTATVLLNAGAEVNARCGEGSTALHKAAAGSPDVVAVLLSHGANPDLQDWCGDTPLHESTTYGCPEATAHLLASGADFKLIDDLGYQPIHIASIHNDSAAVSMLLNAGADVNACSSQNQTPLHLCESESVQRVLLANGADPNAITKSDRTTPLMDAVRYERPELILGLLNAGANPDLDTHGRYHGIAENMGHGLASNAIKVWRTQARGNSSAATPLEDIALASPDEAMARQSRGLRM